MKLFISILCLLLVGCATEFEFWTYEWDGGPEVGSIVEAHNAVYENIVRDGGSEEWKLPHETWNDEAGDCEDKCILMMFLLHRDLGIDTDMGIYAIKHWPSGEPENWSYSYHTVVLMDDGHYYDPTTKVIEKLMFNQELVERYNYGRTMFLAVIK